MFLVCHMIFQHINWCHKIINTTAWKTRRMVRTFSSICTWIASTIIRFFTIFSYKSFGTVTRVTWFSNNTRWSMFAEIICTEIFYRAVCSRVSLVTVTDWLTVVVWTIPLITTCDSSTTRTRQRFAVFSCCSTLTITCINPILFTHSPPLHGSNKHSFRRADTSDRKQTKDKCNENYRQCWYSYLSGKIFYFDIHWHPGRRSHHPILERYQRISNKQ